MNFHESSSISKELSLRLQEADQSQGYYYSYTSTAANTRQAQVQNQQVQPASPAAPITQNRTQPVKVVNKKRFSFSYKLKQEVIKHYKVEFLACPCTAMINTVTYFALSNVKEHSVQNFLRKEYQNKIFQANGEKILELDRIRTRKSTFPKIEEGLKQFFEANVCLNISDLRMQAELIKSSLPPDDKERKFEASNCYFQNFMSRQNISLQVPCSKKTRLTPELQRQLDNVIQMPKSF
ncbi:Hypothetical_protein [Hexamita inflata]|uniref:Hypothetical_protein n=1 Tax=Hexamita inflata TaxID=28002 RepID=A0AA86QC30_9EUKA|nr:Hypothetical protein HINF_LOCUS37957 [Hexamita inflata]